ncbi:acyl-CoA dehydrogenase family protein [Paenirhodobacter enshiensis]|uniref:acyl-CoA dehydrogenase family protein n=1 Tax=Paenirhodobacter enshiensis TaxID=1105367 RepID=UPI0035B3999F
MDFDLTSEQGQLKDSIGRYLAGRYSGLEAREAMRRRPEGRDPALWQGLAELGLLGMPFAEEDGGYAGGPVETMIAMEAIGRSLALEPFLATGVLGAAALRFGASAAQKARLIPEIAAGDLCLSVALTEPGARHDLGHIATRAEETPAGPVLSGRKDLILWGESAGTVVVPARLDTGGVGLFLVDPQGAGAQLSGYAAQDGSRLADLVLDRAPAERLGPAEGSAEDADGLTVIERIAEAGIAALAAEAVGAMEELHRLTVDYLKTRRQFGVPIGSFQSLQHKAVDMLLMVEQARSMACYGAMMVEADDPAERRAALSAVKVQINRSARFVGQTAVQLHGGIGMTMEYIGAHYFKRLTVIETQLGDTAFHLARVADAGGLIAAE